MSYGGFSDVVRGYESIAAGHIGNYWVVIRYCAKEMEIISFKSVYHIPRPAQQ